VLSRYDTLDVLVIVGASWRDTRLQHGSSTACARLLKQGRRSSFLSASCRHTLLPRPDAGGSGVNPSGWMPA
jgi:hypothetical protein